MNSMLLIMRITILIGAMVMFCGSIQAREISSKFIGNWVGVIEAGDKRQFITVSLTGNEPVAGQMNAPLEGFTGKFTSIKIAGSRIRCELNEGAVKLLFNGEITSDGISGQVEGGGQNGRFYLIRVTQVNSAAMANYTGAYRFRDGRELLIDSFPDFPNTLIATDVRTGEVRAFFPVSETKFVAGRELFVPYPTEQTISFRRNGASVGGLERERNSPATETATKVVVRREEVTFKNGDVTLAGTLLLPAAKRGQLFPAVVFTHGGGAALREWFWGLGYLFAARGIAVLSFDKRGVGGSSGNWRESKFEDLADDAAAAASFLQSRNDIETKKIGFWGLSQGGWIAPLAAARFKDSAFAVALSGGGISPAEQELFDTEYELRKASLSEAEIKEALSFQILRNRFAQTGENWNEYQNARGQANGKKWFKFPGTDTWGPLSPDDPYWAAMRRFYFYDPAPTLRDLKCPILAVFGGLDTPNGVKANVSAMNKILKDAGKTDYTVKIYQRGRHNLLEAEETAQNEQFARLKRFVPGLFETMTDWVAKRVKSGNRQNGRINRLRKVVAAKL